MRILKSLIIILLVTISTKAEIKGGMHFFKGSFDQAVELAKAGDKLIFIDFYTQWCGPCLNMAEDVFPIIEVGNFYNTNFVNIKIDAETEEGRILAKKYGVRSYPTYSFVNPKNRELVHASSGRQEPETFIFTGQSAITPELTSTYLESEYQAGNRSFKFLSAYSDYLASRHNRNTLLEVVNQLVELSDFSLETQEGWKVFEQHIKGYDNKCFKEVSKNKEKYVALFGEERVDKKFYNELNYCKDLNVFNIVPDFNGKAFLEKKNRANQAINEEDYEEADMLITELIDEHKDFEEDFCQFLLFSSRSIFYKEHSDFWTIRCVKYLQYVAYNHPNRQDPIIHHDYARALEFAINKYRLTGLPSEIGTTPKSGKDNYNMRSSKLKAKPKRK